MTVGEAFLSAFLGVLFHRLTSKDVLDIVRGFGIEKDLKRLEKTLKNVKAFLNDAERQQWKSNEVKDWMDDLKDAVYDADDVLDEFAYEAYRRTVEAESSQSSPIQLWNKMSDYLSKIEIESKIKAINERFDGLAEERSELGLEEVAAGTPSIQGRETSSVIGETPIYGRDAEKDEIIQLMVKSPDPGCVTKFSVISIVAMGGIGKTTLAQYVYNDNLVKGHFDLRAWVCVSDDFTAKRITKDILSNFTSGTSDSNTLDQVQSMLEKKLAGKKFLIVLDDVWSKDYIVWDVLQKPLTAGAAGSIVIVTTREKEVALMMGTAEYHYLKHLSDDDCWSVFKRHAFVNRDVDMKPKLAKIGMKLAKKCKGLPLAAKMLGGLLRSKPEEDEWEDILNSEIWDPETVDGILPELRLSYHHLPSHLKRCFSYCAVLPKDYEFEKMELVLLWMAEGLVQQTARKKQMEDVGLGYFQELVSRSFFQPSSSNTSMFVMHDLINDLARLVAGKTCFRLEGENKISKKARHLSYDRSRLHGVKKIEGIDKATSLRTLLPLMTKGDRFNNHCALVDLLPTLSCLKVLSLCGCAVVELPDSIGKMKHLRYLDLSCTYIRSLPESTCTLYNLQTLILNDCCRLKKLPEKMRNLINLRHLDISRNNLIEEMPPGIGELSSLQKLSDFVVASNSGSTIKELANLNHLCGTLRISRLDVIQARDAMEANLKDKQDLVALTVEWRYTFNDSRKEGVEKDVLEMLRPHTNLEELTIKWYGGVRLPSWIGDPSFSNMVLVKLEHCVKCTSLPPLGQLSLLKDLCINSMSGVKVVGPGFYGNGWPKFFPSLETLRFQNLWQWEDWSPPDINRQVEVFPQLRKLSIEDCPELRGSLPDYLPLLEKLVIHNCKRLTVSIPSLPKLRKLNIEQCQEVVQGNAVDLCSLKSIVLRRVSKLTCLTEGFLRGLKEVEVLEIEHCSEITCLWQKGVGLLQHLTSLCHLKINSCPKFVALVAEKEEEEVEQHQQGLPCRLESLELYMCDNLEKLQGLPNTLRKLTIDSCKRVVSFPKTGLPPMLRELEIKYCEGLKSLLLSIMLCNNHSSLEYLHIWKCDSLTFIARGQLPSTLKTLRVDNCEYLSSVLVEEEEASLHSSNYSGGSLIENLFIKGCPSLKTLSSRNELPISLKSLTILDCPKLESIAKWLHNNNSLECIEIFKCESLKSLPEGLHNLNHLSSIQIRWCPSLVSFPDGGLPATCLRKLEIKGCETLQSPPPRMHNLTSLQTLLIKDCPASIVSFPEEGFPTNITSLEIINVRMCKPLFEWDLHLLTSLQRLHISGVCPDLVSFPEENEEKLMILPASLTSLTIEDFPNLEYLSSNGFHNLTSLEKLGIIRCPKLKSFPDLHLPTSLQQLRISGVCPDLVSFPEESEEKLMILPASLTDLTIEDFPNLEYLSSNGFHNLTSLTVLKISRCPKLKSFPDKGMPPSLCRLHIQGCPLRQRYSKDEGIYRHEISHVPYVFTEMI